jgi:phage tail sheath protein FI
MAQYFSPGVYTVEVPPQLRAIEGVSTSIAGLVGFAARGPVAGFPVPFAPGVPTVTQPLLLLAPADSAPVLVTSLPQYTSIFGPLPATPSTMNHDFLGHAVRAFFDNGGQEAYIARVVSTETAGDTATNAFAQLVQGVALRLTANAKIGAMTVALDSLRGIQGGGAATGPSTLAFTNISGVQSTYSVAAYNTQSGTVTLSSPLTQACNVDDTFVTIQPPSSGSGVSPQLEAIVTGLSGTVAVTNGSTTITFSTAQPFTLPAGTPLTFASQPGAAPPYKLAFPVFPPSTSATLTTAYTGTSAASTSVVATVLVSVTDGSPSITFSLPQTLAAGTPLVFSSQTTATYFLASAMTAATTGSLTTAYTGTTSTTATVMSLVLDGPQFYARSPGSWGGNVKVLVSNSDEAPTQITAGAVASNVLQVQTSASFYPGAILEVDKGGGNGARDYFTVVQVINSTRVQVDRVFDLTLPSPGPVNGLLVGTVDVTSASAAITFSTGQTLTAGTTLTFDSQPGISYTVTSFTDAFGATLTTNYTGPTNPTAAIAQVTPLIGTADVTNGSTTVTFVDNQTLPSTAQLTFTSEPGVVYAITGAVTNATSATLATAYTGTTSTATQVAVVDSALAGTASVTNGSATVAFSSGQTAQPPWFIEFGSQPGVFYAVATLTDTKGATLSTSYTGTTTAAAHATDLSLTVAVTAGSNMVTFAALPGLAAGTAISFASQTGVPYVVATATTTSTSATLTTAYSGPSGTTNATFVVIPPYARVVEFDVLIVDTASGRTETYQRLTWGMNTTEWPFIQAAVQSRHYANIINTQSSLVYVQPPGVPVVPATSMLTDGTEAFAGSTGGSQLLPLAYQPQSFYSVGGTQAFAFPETLDFGGSDGALPLVPGDFIGVDNGPGLRTGIEALQDANVNIIAVPGETTNEVQQALITQCEVLLDRFAVLDGQLGPPNDATAILAHRNNYASSYAGYYVPWVEIENAAGTATIDLPPSGYVMGVYARVDNNPGVWEAPANQPLQNIVGLQSYITKGEQDILNPAGVNCIRKFPGRGILVWGARTLSADPATIYVNVRRFLIFLEQSLIQGTQWVVFQPNSPPTWSRVVDSVTAFLTTLWADGALFGLKPSDAFFVRCDQTTMTADDIQNGRLICKIGVAIVRPAEFVIFQIEQITGSASGS